MQNINLLKAIGFFITALIFVLSAVFFSSYITNYTQGNKIKETKTPFVAVTCSPDNLSYKQTAQTVSLISNKINLYAEDSQFVNPQIVIAKTETSTSKFACGYLFVKAGTNTNGALQSWEDVYISPNGFGGHLDKNSAFSVNDGKQYSEYLYPLNKIQYWTDTSHKNILTADWASLLNVSNDINFNINLNSNDKTGFIDEISIAYKCWNPETGEENTGCKLTAEMVNK